MQRPAEQPVLQTGRLVLRPFSPDDAPAVQLLAGASEVADTTLHIPHPYPPGAAEQWMASHGPAWAGGAGVTYAITAADTGAVMGAIGLTIAAAHDRAELGYWVGVPYWGRGYCTEAGHAMLALAFATLALHRVQARHLRQPPAMPGEPRR